MTEIKTETGIDGDLRDLQKTVDEIREEFDYLRERFAVEESEIRERFKDLYKLFDEKSRLDLDFIDQKIASMRVRGGNL